jgi:hypothetical protein
MSIVITDLGPLCAISPDVEIDELWGWEVVSRCEYRT